MSRPRYVKLAPHSPHVVRTAFTLVELLVVIVIIGILSSIALTVGNRVAKGGERGLTEQTIRVLDTALGAYLGERESKFPSYYVDHATPTPNVFPIVDGQPMGHGTPGETEPTIALFFLIAGDVPAVQDAVKSLDSKLLVRKPVQRLLAPPATALDKNNMPVQALYVNDAWGNPIRFVVPRYHGGHGDALGVSSRPLLDVQAGAASGQYLRTYRPLSGTGIGSADEGLCPGGRPYFYSAGPDGDPGTREDNVYTITPKFPLETAKLQ